MEDLSAIHGAKHLGEAIMERRDAFSRERFMKGWNNRAVYLDTGQVPDSWWTSTR